MFTTREIDALCEFVLEQAAGRAAPADAGAAALVARMAGLRPEAPALSAVLPLAMAAAALDEMLAAGPAGGAAPALWRGAALIAAEVLALQAADPGGAPPRLDALARRLAGGGAG